MVPNRFNSEEICLLRTLDMFESLSDELAERNYYKQKLKKIRDIVHKHYRDVNRKYRR